MGGGSDNHWLKLFGLPYSVTVNDIVDFVGSGYTISNRDVIIDLQADGRKSGAAYVNLRSRDDVQRAIKELDKQYIGSRYVECSAGAPPVQGQGFGGGGGRGGDTYATRDFREREPRRERRGPSSMGGETWVHLRGLPWSAREVDVLGFFGPNFDISMKSVVLPMEGGRSSGRAFVKLSPSEISSALRLDRKHMGDRYIEVSEARPEEVNRAL